MGASKSKTAKNYPVGDANDKEFSLEDLPEEVLIHLLIFVPAKDIIVNLRRVCNGWKELIDTKSLWIAKCHNDGVFLPPILLQEEIPVDLKKICLGKPFNRNLLLNWNAEDGLNHWEILENGGDKFQVENEVPAGANSLSEVKDWDVKKCWATSFFWCTKGQHVDLWKHGCSLEILNGLKPVIEVSEWISPRYDCASKYEMQVRLMDENKTEIEKFNTERREEPGLGKGWSKVEHKFVNYGPGVRYVHFVHRGADQQFWAGHYGMKMAAPCVKISFPN